MGLATNGTIDPTLVDFFFENMQRVVAAGVRVNFIACFDPDESFSFDGVGPIGLGFSSTGAPTTGGQFAFLHRQTKPEFAFDSSASPTVDPDGGGFGAIADPLVGGFFQGL